MTARPKKKVIFRRYRRDPRTGVLLDAWRYGLKAWPIPVDDDSR
jgi:hypothetical protein